MSSGLFGGFKPKMSKDEAIWAVLLLVLLLLLASETRGDVWHNYIGRPASTTEMVTTLAKLREQGLVGELLTASPTPWAGQVDLVFSGDKVGTLIVGMLGGQPVIVSLSLSVMVAKLAPSATDTEVRSDVGRAYGGEWEFGETTDSELCSKADCWRMFRPADGMVIQGWSLKEGGQLLGLEIIKKPREVR